MAKWIKYKIVCNATKNILLDKKLEYTDANMIIAQSEAYQGEYSIVEDERILEKEPLSIALGGTGAKNAEQARKNIGAVAMKAVTVSLPKANWSNNKQTVNVTGATADNIVLVTATPASYSAYNGAGVYCSAQAAGRLTFSATSTPDADVSANVLILT